MTACSFQKRGLNAIDYNSAVGGQGDIVHPDLAYALLREMAVG